MRVAIVRLSSLGDVIIATSVLGALREHSVEWFVDERFSGVLDNSSLIAKVHTLPFKKLFKSPIGLLKIRKYCRECGEFDVVIDMQGLLKSALVSYFIQTKKRVGFSWSGCREGLASLFYSHKVALAYDENILKRNLGLFGFLNISDENLVLSKIKNIGFDEGRIDGEVKIKLKTHNQYKLLCVLEASIIQKEYPVEKYAALAKRLSGLVKNFCVFVIWNQNEKKANAMCEELQNLGVAYCKLPRLDLNALKFCIAHMDCVIGGDTGVTHLAWAMGRECVTLYGNASSTSGKNMSSTKLDRVLLGNPYLISQSKEFEIASISEHAIYDVFVEHILPNVAQDRRFQ